MNTEREKAINKFLDKRTESFKLVGMVEDNHDLLKDAGIREAAFEAAQTHYKVMLLQNGVTYLDVFRSVSSVRNGIAQRNGKLDFIKKTEACWDTLHSKQSQATPTVLAPNTECLVTSGNA